MTNTNHELTHSTYVGRREARLLLAPSPAGAPAGAGATPARFPPPMRLPSPFIIEDRLNPPSDEGAGGAGTPAGPKFGAGAQAQGQMQEQRID